MTHDDAVNSVSFSFDGNFLVPGASSDVINHAGARSELVGIDTHFPQLMSSRAHWLFGFAANVIRRNAIKSVASCGLICV